MSEIDDAKEWVEKSGDYSVDKSTDTQKPPEPIRKARSNGQALADKTEDDEESVALPNVPNQYSLYGSGYTASYPTVKRIPAGCYDINEDSRCVYVTPQPPPGGLLLELPEMRSEEVIKKVESFWNSEGDYKQGNDFVQGGAIFKAGVMIYGPPGSGKSCTIKLVSKKLVEKGGTVFYSSCRPSRTMAFLTDFAKIEPNRKCIVILEDIDSLIHNYGEADYLDMLDSARTIDNVLFIATTNYPEHLDPRIYNRPGRFSHVIKIGLPTAAAREAYLKAILKNHRDVETIVKQTDNFTIDHLTALINAVYREKKDLNDEIKRLGTLFKIPPKSDNDRPSVGISG